MWVLIVISAFGMPGGQYGGIQRYNHAVSMQEFNSKIACEKAKAYIQRWENTTGHCFEK